MSAIDTSTPPHFVCTRVFDAPREVLFRAFMDPEILARWWGPAEFTSTFQEFTPEPRGMWRFIMHGPDGQAYSMVNEFLDIVPGRKIVLQHHQPNHDFRLQMDYTNEDRKTRLTWRMWFDSADEAERVRPYVNQANEQNCDRLAAQLTSR